MGLISFFAMSCEFDEQIDPNNPSVNSVLNDATVADLNLLAIGVQAQMREGLEIYVTSSGTIARELYKFDADPRNTEDLLGKESSVLDANTFYLTGWYTPFFRTIKTANTLIEAADASTNINDAERNGYKGFANTVIAYQMLRSLAMLGCNGLRVDVADETNLGPFLDENAAYAAIRAKFDEASAQLGNANFLFTFSSGFAGFDSPATFLELNRGLAARAAIYAGDYAGALAEVNKSFLEPGGSLTIGPKFSFSSGGNDLLNPLFKTPGQSGDQIIVHNGLLADAEAGDARLSKFGARTNATSQDGLSGTHETRLFPNNVAPVDIIRNEELLLILAEASIQTGDIATAVNTLNYIRNTHGLPNYSGAQDVPALTNEMLKQRRYSLWGEGHRMFDLRRYDRLNENFLPIDRPGDDVWDHFPIPQTEAEPNKC